MPGDFLDCETCTDPHTRRCLGCGFLPSTQHLAGDRPFPEATVCPGYLVRLPEVVEAARARSWTKRGGLTPLYGSKKLPMVALDAIDILESAANEQEARSFRERQEERHGSA